MEWLGTLFILCAVLCIALLVRIVTGHDAPVILAIWALLSAMIVGGIFLLASY